MFIRNRLYAQFLHEASCRFEFALLQDRLELD